MLQMPISMVQSARIVLVLGFAMMLGNTAFAQFNRGLTCPPGYYPPGTICTLGLRIHRHYRRYRHRHYAWRYREERLSTDFGGAR
jgi:hypothetical protein